MSTEPFETPEVNHVLLGTDRSDEAKRSQRWAMGIAASWSAKVTVVCAFDSPRSFRKRGSLLLPEVRDDMEAEAREVAAEAASELQTTASTRRRSPSRGRRSTRSCTSPRSAARTFS